MDERQETFTERQARLAEAQRRNAEWAALTDEQRDAVHEQSRQHAQAFKQAERDALAAQRAAEHEQRITQETEHLYRRAYLEWQVEHTDAGQDERFFRERVWPHQRQLIFEDAERRRVADYAASRRKENIEDTLDL